MGVIKITNIYWDKAYLVIEYYGAKNDKWSISDGNRTAELVLCGDNKVTLFVCEFNGEGMLPEGDWVLESEENEYSIGPEVMSEIPNLSHAFVYTDKLKSYVVQLWVDDEDQNKLRISTRFMRHNANPEKRTIDKNIIKAFADLYYKFWRVFRNRNRSGVLFLSETRSDMSDNFRTVYDKMIERGLDQTHNISQHLVNYVGGESSRFKKMALVRKIAKYDYIFVDDYVPVFTVIDRAPEVKLIQLWHAGFGYKLVGYGRFGRKGSPHPYQSCHRKYTHAVVGNEALKEVYREVFAIPTDRMIASGMPRLEHFLDSDIIDEARDAFFAKYPQLVGKRIILFAPTYRGLSQKDAYYDYDMLPLDDLYDACEKTNSIMIFKWHHFIKEKLEIADQYRDRLIDLSDESINKLMYISDVLITDYSSCFYDYVLLEKPIIFYIYDEAEYTANRGVHKPVGETAPGIICRSQEELIATIEKKDIPRTEPKPYMVDNCLINKNRTASDIILDVVFGDK